MKIRFSFRHNLFPIVQRTTLQSPPVSHWSSRYCLTHFLSWFISNQCFQADTPTVLPANSHLSRISVILRSSTLYLSCLNGCKRSVTSFWLYEDRPVIPRRSTIHYNSKVRPPFFSPPSVNVVCLYHISVSSKNTVKSRKDHICCGNDIQLCGLHCGLHFVSLISFQQRTSRFWPITTALGVFSLETRFRTCSRL